MPYYVDLLIYKNRVSDFSVIPLFCSSVKIDRLSKAIIGDNNNYWKDKIRIYASSYPENWVRIVKKPMVKKISAIDLEINKLRAKRSRLLKKAFETGKVTTRKKLDNLRTREVA